MNWGSWNIRLYYSPQSITQAIDPHADAILTQLLKPSIAYAIEQGWIKYWTFLRFSEQGYHIRLAVYGAADVLQQQFQPWIQQTWSEYVVDHPMFFQTVQPLSPYAQILNRKLGFGTEIEHLMTPGSITWEWSDDIGVGSDFASLAEFERAYMFQSAFSQHCLDVLELGLDLKTRKTFVRLLIDDLLRVSLLKPNERFQLLQRLNKLWTEYFEMDSALIQQYQALIKQKSTEYYAFFQQKTAFATSLRLLPPQSHAIYRAFEQTGRELFPAVMQRTPAGEPSVLGLTLITGLIHLVHNRLSLPITDEVYLTLMLSDYYQTLLQDQYQAQSQILFAS